MTTRHKVLAYITHGTRLLIFRQPESPAAGLQVPAGTIEPNETPDAAVMREAFEETGLADLQMISKVGHYHYYPKPDICHERHVYHLVAVGDVPNEWRHYERDSNTHSGDIPFDFIWVDLFRDTIDLAAGQGDFLTLLRQRIQRETPVASQRNSI